MKIEVENFEEKVKEIAHNLSSIEDWYNSLLCPEKLRSLSADQLEELNELWLGVMELGIYGYCYCSMNGYEGAVNEISRTVALENQHVIFEEINRREFDQAPTFTSDGLRNPHGFVRKKLNEDWSEFVPTEDELNSCGFLYLQSEVDFWTRVLNELKILKRTLTEEEIEKADFPNKLKIVFKNISDWKTQLNIATVKKLFIEAEFEESRR